MLIPMPPMATSSERAVSVGSNPAGMPGRNASSATMWVAQAVQPDATTLTPAQTRAARPSDRAAWAAIENEP